MKKFSVIKALVCACLTVFSVVALMSCQKQESDFEYDGDGLVATVVEAHEGYLLVEPVEGSSELSSSDRFNVPNYFEGRVRKGDTVIIEHDGMIQETYPASFHKIFSMTLVGDDGENESVIID